MLAPELLSGLSVYQDVVLDGHVVRRGRRGCQDRWELMADHLPKAGVVIDVGSNFGWFGVKLCQEHSRCVVASVEADLRSAAVQRQVLASHAERRMCLLTRKAGAGLVRAFAARGQRFEAAMCLSVLHWLRDHRGFLIALGDLTEKLFVELPDPREAGAGVERLRREIGPLGPYLASCFPDRTATCLGATASHRSPDHVRELWMVGPPERKASDAPAATGALDFAAMSELDMSWPPRSWWESELERVTRAAALDGWRPEGRWSFTSAGLACTDDASHPFSAADVRRRLRKIPEQTLLARPRAWQRRVRNVAADLRNWMTRRWL